MADRRNRNDIFRDKNLTDVSSSERLDRYISSTRPSVWLLFFSVILLLIGIIVWAVFGKIDSADIAGCRAENHILTTYVREEDSSRIGKDSYIGVYGKGYPLLSVTGPILADDESDAFLLQAAGIEKGDWYCAVTCPADLKDGEYKGKIVYQEMNPITFIIN